MDVLALIPARGGSRSIPRKNIKHLAGIPLIAYSIEAARRAPSVSRVIVSTDDPEIAEISRSFGAETPLMRPAELAQDDTLDLPVFQHALTWLDEHEHYRPDLIVHLRPTSPLRRVKHIEEGVQVLRGRPEADSVRAVAISAQTPYKMWRIDQGNWIFPLLTTELHEPYNMPRQLLPQVYWHTGVLDVIRWRTIVELRSMTGGRIAPLVVDGDASVDIDTERDLECAEFLITSGRVRTVFSQAEGSEGAGRLPPFENVRLLVTDCDGVLTNNRVWVDEAGREAMTFSRSDGMGLELVRRAGVEVLVISSESNPVVAFRCDKLKIPFEHGLADKREALLRFTRSREIPLERTAYVGNDVNDIPCMELVGFPVAVPDAHPEVIRRARWVLTRSGGYGAIREICDLIVRARQATQGQRERGTV